LAEPEVAAAVLAADTASMSDVEVAAEAWLDIMI
jgi:hypothetical protein